MLDLAEEYAPYYQERAGEKERARQVGWRDRHAQHTRFEQFVRAIRHPADSSFDVADIGCGLGDLLPFLRANGFRGLRYRGYDIVPSMITRAAAYHDDPNAAFRWIKDVGEVEQTDYCFASGVFNAKLGHGDEEWWEHVQTCVREMAARSSHAAAFNMLSTFSDEERREASLYYANPCRVFDWCKREITRDVALFHDYGQWDFTILLRMDQAGRPLGPAS